MILVSGLHLIGNVDFLCEWNVSEILEPKEKKQSNYRALKPAFQHLNTLIFIVFSFCVYSLCDVCFSWYLLRYFFYFFIVDVMAINESKWLTFTVWYAFWQWFLIRQHNCISVKRHSYTLSSSYYPKLFLNNVRDGLAQCVTISISVLS